MVSKLDWFNKEIRPLVKKYEVIYKRYDTGDFGALDQIEINSAKIGAQIDIWSSGWLGILVWDFVAETEILNILVEPNEEIKQQEVLQKFKTIIVKSG